ncbi:MAG: twin-arginine translocation signal domain-containing protein [Coriobacteriales bacterium]|nr:twin-arginine translocation signal domain-containing protein [Coriobacteriales bacterium]
MENVTRRSFLKGSVSAAALAGLGLAVVNASVNQASAGVIDENGLKVNAYDLDEIDPEKLMPAELGYEWHAYKDACGPLYPGYPHYDEYLDWVEQKLTEYGCVDKLQHEWQMQSYFCNDWPVHEGSMSVVLDGEEIEAGANPRLCGDEDHQSATGEMVFVDIDTDPETVKGAYEGKILVTTPAGYPEKPYTDSFKGTYVITDTNYRTAPEFSVGIGEIVPETENNSWHTRWDFGQWSKACKLVRETGAAGGIILTSLTWGTLKGLVDRQGSNRTQAPIVCLDFTYKDQFMAAAEAGKEVTVNLKAEYLKAVNHNYFMFLPGKYYGTDQDEYITINSHSDAMNLTQDNGALGTLGIIHYFSQIPQEERNRTIVACIDTRHFIEGAEGATGVDWEGNSYSNREMHEPYRCFPEVAEKTIVTIGLEHMGELEAAEDYENNDIVVTGRPELSFMKADDNDWCARILIQAATDSGLERADIKVDGRPGNFGEFKGTVRAVQASTHQLPVCVIGEAGNWPGAHTQMYTGIRFFSDKKFRDEVDTWTRVTNAFMQVDKRVFDPCWSNLNKAVRSLGSKELINNTQMNGLLGNIADIFGGAAAGKYEQAAFRLEAETKKSVMGMAPEGTDFSAEGALGEATGLSSGATLTEGSEFQGVVALIDAVIAKMA